MNVSPFKLTCTNSRRGIDRGPLQSYDQLVKAAMQSNTIPEIGKQVILAEV